MRFGYLIPALLAGALTLSGCGGEAPKPAEPAAPAKPAPTVAELPAPYNEADVAAGKSLFGRKCASCHYIQASKGNLVGPNLHGLFGRKAGTAANYTYSPAMKNAAFTWDEEKLRKWIKKPQEFVPGTKMPFPGFPAPETQDNIIAYLKEATK